jgi:hypothetical protein
MDDLTAGPALRVLALHASSVESMPAVAKLQLPARDGQNDPVIALGRKNWSFAGSDADG